MATHTAMTIHSALEKLDRTQDGDTIRLVWPGASIHAKQAVESRALALGLDIIVEVGPPRPP